MSGYWLEKCSIIAVHLAVATEERVSWVLTEEGIYVHSIPRIETDG